MSLEQQLDKREQRDSQVELPRWEYKPTSESLWTQYAKVDTWKESSDWRKLQSPWDPDLKWALEWELWSKEFVKWNIEKWNTVEVDFKWDIRSEFNLWLSDLMPAKVRKVKIEWERFGRKYDIEWERKWLKWWFFSDKNEYIPVFSWFKVTIIETATDEELANIWKQNEEKIRKYMENPKIQDFNQKYWEKETRAIITSALEYEMDPMVLMTLRRTENWAAWKEFWVLRPWAETYDYQLILACRTIQNNMNRYKNLSWKDAQENWIITPEFLCFFSSRYAPIWALNDPNNFNANHLKNMLRIYGNFHDRSYSEEDISKIYASTQDIREKMYAWWEIIWKTDSEGLIQVAQYYLGMRYQMWGTWNWSIDCSQLVVQWMKEKWVASFNYDNNAQWLYRLTNPKDTSSVQRWDLVFLQEPDGRISHVEIARWTAIWNEIPIIDASSTVWKVSERTQKISWWTRRVLVWTPTFYW